ncbi:protein RDR1 [Aspergillus lentulus]|uniref:Protein RDR1 n=1 Tax=Aspergillus lentulus TaxID=293939 RepID=A0ABQ1AKF4_ASPLE|nr:protein RDR1 [Aspergillus lentulus]GFF51840.1 protein RDR1 [Aspergillus lentulus]GFF76058.1 protein RDR1 [Aspergillus lentulus]GFF83530.1 protein RDR1 [Aspergillus lentulus]GFF87442.1 protein RDR1 [Aspergillus lentulus]GFG11990.1 protein RDR1 [Aspergillus lentulus]
MVCFNYLLQALVVITLPAWTLGWGILPFQSYQHQQQPVPQSQTPLEGPGCDGSGIVDPGGRCNGDGLVDSPPDHRDREGFKFENPSTDCKYVSQMHIWDSFKDLEKDMNKLFTLIHKNVSFTVVGHHPIAGHYNDLLHFYVNALRRVSVLFLDHADKFEIHPQAIHGGCNERWSVQEVNFRGVMNSGDDFDIVNVWVTRWDRGQMVEIRTYIDSARIMEALHKNEIWWNGTTFRDNIHYMPGPAGMPDLKKLEDLMGYPDGRKYED